MSKVVTDPAIIDDFLKRRIDSVIPNKKALREALLSGKRLKLYQGYDATSPNLHIGHLVGLLTLKMFQDLGHEVIFLVGDFTSTIGDPTDKLEARKVLTKAQVLENAKTYQEQASMVLNFAGDNPVQLKFNSEWNSKLGFDDVLKLSQHFTVQQMIERDMFQVRIKSNKEVYLNEFLYPLIQGYDSVVLDVDLEVGGNDQLFNMMAGRKLAKEMTGKDKLVVTTQLLADSTGKKIGKTEGNAINIANTPEELFGQMMSLPDGTIASGFSLLTYLHTSELVDLDDRITKDPMREKKRLAWEMIKMLRGEETANKAQKHFEITVQGNEVPEDIPTFPAEKLKKATNLVEIIVQTSLASSKSEARRLISQKAVKVNEQIISDQNATIEPKPGTIIRTGKRRWLKLK
jgi:tyrosyl-tRNA synthetase